MTTSISTFKLPGSSHPVPNDLGFALRDNLHAQPQIPAQPPFAMCPDIILSGTQVADPQSESTTVESLDTLYDCDPNPAGENFYYVRALNGGAPATSVTFSFYACPLQLLPLPQTWQNNALLTATGVPTVKGTAAKGHYAVGSEPFVLDKPGDGIGTFVAIAAETTPVVPTVKDWLDMSNLFTQRPDIGFNSVGYIQAADPSGALSLGLQVPESFTDAAAMTIAVTSSGFSGNKLGLVADCFAADGSLILLQPAALVDGAVEGLSISVAPGFRTNLTVQIFGGGSAVAAGSTITLTVNYTVPDHQIGEALTRAALDSRHARSMRRGSGIGVGPTAMVPVGAVTLVAQ